jgi:hypothetical protein
MAMSAFLLIGTLMVCQVVGNRVAPAAPGARDEDDTETETIGS